MSQNIYFVLKILQFFNFIYNLKFLKFTALFSRTKTFNFYNKIPKSSQNDKQKMESLPQYHYTFFDDKINKKKKCNVMERS
jgi:hypothetical protein